MSAESVRVKVAEQMGGLSPKVLDRVVETIAEKELLRRTEACVKVWAQLELAERDLLKVNREDGVAVTFNAEGKKEEMKWFTPARVKEIEKAQEKIAKIKKALDKALDPKNPDCKDVFDLANSGGKPADGKSDPAKSDGVDKEAS